MDTISETQGSFSVTLHQPLEDPISQLYKLLSYLLLQLASGMMSQHRLGILSLDGTSRVPSGCQSVIDGKYKENGTVVKH